MQHVVGIEEREDKKENTEISSEYFYSAGVIVPNNYQTIYVSGQIGESDSGETHELFEHQAIQACENFIDVLNSANMDVLNIVKTTVYLTDSKNIEVWRKIKNKLFKGSVAASTLVIVKELVRPELQIEIEGIASAKN